MRLFIGLLLLSTALFSQPSKVEHGDLSVWALIWNAGFIVQLVILLLLVMSILSWAIIAFKYYSFNLYTRRSSKFLDLFWESNNLVDIYAKLEDLPKSPISSVFKAGYLELSKLSKVLKQKPDNQKDLSKIETIRRSLSKEKYRQKNSLEALVTWLATIGSVSPFIGLFGTVWGIMSSFQEIGSTGSASLAVVAPGISEALIATAFGLFAAIPAVIAYNFYVTKIKRLMTEIDSFSADFLNIVDRFLVGKANDTQP